MSLVKSYNVVAPQMIPGNMMSRELSGYILSFIHIDQFYTEDEAMEYISVNLELGKEMLILVSYKKIKDNK